MNAPSVLVLGAYFENRDSRIRHIVAELQRSTRWTVEQRWIALGSRCPDDLEHCTVEVSQRGDPKFKLLNRQLDAIDPSRYAYIIVADDDISLPAAFLDSYLALVELYDFALAQPARTFTSYTDHHFVTQLHGIRARQTRFVEIGPLFSVRADALSVLTPFDEVSPMGWGYDFVWPVLMERAGLCMGIVDALPVAHDLRKPVSSYSHEVASTGMARLLAKHPSLDKHDAFSIVRSYP